MFLLFRKHLKGNHIFEQTKIVIQDIFQQIMIQLISF